MPLVNIPRGLFGLLAALASHSAWAGGPLTTYKHEYGPIVTSTLGRVESCGLSFTAAVTGFNRAFFVESTVVSTYFKDKVPGFIFKLFVAEIYGGGVTERRAVRFGYLRVASSSTAKLRSFPGEDRSSRLYFGDAQADGFGILEIPHTFALRGGQVGFNIEDGQDFTFSLPPPNDARLLTSIAECGLEGISNVEEDMKRSPKR